MRGSAIKYCVTLLVLLAAVAVAEPAETVIVPHMAAELDESHNVLYCPAFQLAWQSLRKRIGDDIKLQDQPAVAELLNEERADPSDFESAKVLAIAGSAREGIIEKARTKLAKVYGTDSPFLKTFRPPTPVTPNDLYAFSWLDIRLRYAEKLEVFPSPLWFPSGKKRTPVTAFGLNDALGMKHSGKTRLQWEQLKIVDFGGTDDFIVVLQARSTGPEHIVLAKIPPEATLLQTWRNVEKRIEKPRRIDPIERIKIPRISLDIEQTFEELINKSVLNEKHTGLTVRAAHQWIRLILNEEGAELSSRGKFYAMGAGYNYTPPEHQRHLLFDGPFLVALRTPGKKPYLVAWIQNRDAFEPSPDTANVDYIMKGATDARSAAATGKPSWCVKKVLDIEEAPYELRAEADRQYVLRKFFNTAPVPAPELKGEALGDYILGYNRTTARHLSGVHKRDDFSGYLETIIRRRSVGALYGGLTWLEKNQNEDGFWGKGALEDRMYLTALAAKCFHMPGHTMAEGKYKKQMARTIHWLCSSAADAPAPETWQEPVCLVLLTEYENLDEEEKKTAVSLLDKMLAKPRHTIWHEPALRAGLAVPARKEAVTSALEQHKNEDSPAARGPEAMYLTAVRASLEKKKVATLRHERDLDDSWNCFPYGGAVNTRIYSTCFALLIEGAAYRYY